MCYCASLSELQFCHSLQNADVDVPHMTCALGSAFLCFSGISINTHPESGHDSHRQQHWGQLARFVADEDGVSTDELPKEFMVEEGEDFLLECRIEQGEDPFSCTLD